MKIDLSKDAVVATNEMLSKLKEINPYLGKRYSQFVSKLVVYASDKFKRDDLVQLSDSLLTEKSKRKFKLKQLEKLLDQVDETVLKKLETKAKNLHQNSQFPEGKSSISSEKYKEV